MALSTKARYWRALILIAVVVAGMWGFIGLKGYEPRLGLDLQGGIAVVLAPKPGEPADPGSLEKAIDIIRNRVDALGVAEPEIARQGENILIQLPGLKDQASALRLIGTTARLQFRPVLDVVPPTPPEAVDEKKKDEAPGSEVLCADQSTYPDDAPEATIVLCRREQSEAGEDLPRAEWTKIEVGAAALQGDDVADARAELTPQTAQWEVALELTGAGGKKFEDITGALACEQVGDPKRQLAIVLDRVIESSPQINEDVGCDEGIAGGQALITGNFSEREAKDLALVLRYGALPVELEAQTTTTVSPTLGRESLRSGILAAIIGLAIVFVYVALFYRVLGSIVWIGIAVHAAITLGVIILLGQTAGFALTLAGMAGLIVSFGVAADSFIVYFERIRDEVRTGRGVRAAVERAWPSARRTIVAADLVTALAAVVLYFLAVGSVRGFALMLGLATALDLLVSYWFMHPSVALLAGTRSLARSKTLGAREATPAVAGGAR